MEWQGEHTYCTCLKCDQLYSSLAHPFINVFPPPSASACKPVCVCFSECNHTSAPFQGWLCHLYSGPQWPRVSLSAVIECEWHNVMQQALSYIVHVLSWPLCDCLWRPWSILQVECALPTHTSGCCLSGPVCLGKLNIKLNHVDPHTWPPLLVSHTLERTPFRGFA